MAIRNAADAQALIDTAEGAHQEIEFILQRMRELAVQAANDTNGVSDRTALQSEVTSLTAEIDRIANVTSWAGIALLDGPSANAAQTTQTGNKSLVFHIGAGDGSAGANPDATNPNKVVVNIAAMGSTALGIAGAGATPRSLLEITDADNLVAITGGNTITVSAPTDTKSVTLHIDGTTFTTTFAAAGTYATSAVGFAQQIQDTINAQGIAGISVSRAGAVLTVSRGAAVDITTENGATSAISTIDGALNTVNAQRAQLGAISNRLDSTVKNLTNVVTNLEAGRGRVEDADFAAETTNLAKAQILQQASMAMLAQANASKQGVLSLLQR
jgi:flagellin